ncbi:MAG: signal peptidase I [Bdellovibrionales bacterium GWB1_55_8]|nr:MAG: signal peptidase I [Bdellovibrionales bacterium GWB1_55_8]
MSGTTQKTIRDYTIAVTLAVVIALLVRFFLIEAYRIPSQAMKPTLHAGDTIFVSKSPFGLRLPGAGKPFTKGRLPHRGEVVVFSSPIEPDREYIKRVIALPGEKVEIRSGQLFIDGKKIIHSAQKVSAKGEENCGSETLPASPGASFPTLHHGLCWEPPTLEDLPPSTIPEGSVFVLGDLRTAGEGLRRQMRGESWGIIPLNSIRGSALWIWLSVEPGGNDGGWLPKFRLQRMFRRIK